MKLDTNSLPQEQRHGFLGGAFMIILGVFFLAGQWLPDMAWLTLPAIASLLLAWGIITRAAGPLIPAGILSGIALGAFLNSFYPDGDDTGGGVFLLGFAAGWLLIPLLTRVFAEETHWWPLIPAGIMGLIGLSIFMGGFMMTVLAWVGQLWPLVLIVIGAYMLYQQSQKPQEKHPQ
jgi:hypothetical protein